MQQLLPRCISQSDSSTQVNDNFRNFLRESKILMFKRVFCVKILVIII